MEDQPTAPREFEPIGSAAASPTRRPPPAPPPPPPPPGTGWWLASDGNWYPPQARSAPVGPTTTNAYAIASLLLGILWIFWIGSILALLFGYLGKRRIDESHRRETGRGLAIAGIVLGWIGVAVLGLGLLGLAFGSESEPRFDEFDDAVGGETFDVDVATLVESCQSGEMVDCDELYRQSEVDSWQEEVAMSCGGRSEVDVEGRCEVVYG